GLFRMIIVLSAAWGMVVLLMFAEQFPDEATLVRNFSWKVELIAKSAGFQSMKDIRADQGLQGAIDDVKSRFAGYFAFLRERGDELTTQIATAHATTPKLEAERDSSAELRAARMNAEKATKTFHANPNS